MTDPDTRIWQISVAPWIIQDGNYPDFRVNRDPVAFAVEFYSIRGLRKSTAPATNAVSLSGSEYTVGAKVVHLTDKWWVIDFGIMAYCEETPPQNISVGDYVRGDVDLGIDPFFYFEYLCKSEHSPALTYDWEIVSILHRKAPVIEAPGGKTLIPDKTREITCPISHTDAWHEDCEHAFVVDYGLECRPLGGPRFPGSPGNRP